nr:thrombospondin type 3 repeat-containing protein [Deltaproteobacteria bacterium]
MKPTTTIFACAMLACAGTAQAQDPIPVGMIYSSSGAVLPQALREFVAATQEFTSVAMFDASVTTPTSADLAGLSAVLVWNDLPWANGVEMGDVLADFARAGGGVVVAGHTFSPGFELLGTFDTQNFMPVELGVPMTLPGGDLGITPLPGFEWEPVLLQAGHPIFWVVNDVEGGDSEMAVGLQPNVDAVVVGAWDNGENAVFTYEPIEAAFGRIVALNLFPSLSGVSAGGFNDEPLGDFDHLLANALLWSAKWETLAEPDWCYNLEFTQDLNCNHVDFADEEAVDVTVPGCDTEIDPRTGLPYDNADYYWDIHRFDCLYPTMPYFDLRTYDTDVRYDGEADWLSAGTITVNNPDLPFPVESVALTCDNCPAEWNHDQRDRDCDGIGDPCDLCINAIPPFGVHFDNDNDGWGDDACDNAAPSPVCPLPGGPSAFNPDQSDVDADGIGDVCDNCVEVFNPDQTDGDFDGDGDICDNCPPGILPGDPAPSTANPAQDDTDGDGRGDMCDNCHDVDNTDSQACPPYVCPENQGDTDFDGVGDVCDNCPSEPAIDRTDSDLDGVGDACDTCPYLVNPDQADGDADGFGNACDNCPLFTNDDQADMDVDGVGDLCDNCLEVSNADQANGDPDEQGDACDNCPRNRNDQADGDEDGWGDDCD